MPTKVVKPFIISDQLLELALQKIDQDAGSVCEWLTMFGYRFKYGPRKVDIGPIDTIDCSSTPTLVQQYMCFRKADCTGRILIQTTVEETPFSSFTVATPSQIVPLPALKVREILDKVLKYTIQ